MPVGVVSTDYGEPIPLKSAPPDGFVRLRPLPYGMKLERRDKATEMSMEQQTRRDRKSDDDTAKVDIKFLSKWTRNFEFSYCIGDHNITDMEGKKLDFSNQMTLDVLDPKIGTEIEKLLDEINGDDEDLEDFTKPVTSSSLEETPSDSLGT